MARAFSAKDARQLIQQHQKLRNQLIDNYNYAERQKKDSNSIASSLFSRNVFAKLLEDELLSGNIRSLDSQDVQRLLCSLNKYIKGKSLSEDSETLARDTRIKYNQEINNLKPAANAVTWLLTFGKSKAAAEAAYAYLQKEADGTYAWQVQSVAKDIEQLEQSDAAQAVQQFEQNRTSFRDTLYEINSNIFHDRAVQSDIERVYQQHHDLQEQLRGADTSVEQAKETIQAAVERLQALDVLNILKNVPIDELNREKTGIRFKALKDAGYQTVADVYCAAKYNLASVHGISEDAANTLKKCAKQYAQEAKSGAKIRLSVDNQNQEATNLVCALYTYRQYIEALNALNEQRKKHEKTVTAGMDDMQKIAYGSVNWFFYDAAEKKRLSEAYRNLASLANGEYAQVIRDSVRILTTAQAVDAAQAWADFEHNSISYFNILETIVLGVLGNDDKWFGLPEELAREIQEECFFPDGLKCELRRYQEWGVKYILHQERVLLGDEMGLGKTVQAIATLVSLRNTGATHFIVVSPASVVPNWCKEVAEKSKLRVTKIHGAGCMNAFQDWQKNGGVAVTNFETTGYLKVDKAFKFDMMIVDEAHYIKNAEARRTQNVIHLSEHTDRILFMTGTALENKVDEMISLVQVLQPAIASELHHIAFMSSAPQFRERVAPVYYRRKREDVLTELPELIDNKEWCTMSPEETTVYEATVMSKNYMAVRRVSWDIDDLHHSCKAIRMKEIVDEATEDGRKVIIFSNFRETISKIADFMGDVCLPIINGSISPQRRQEIIDEFDKAPAGTVLLAQIQAGGTGLNIQSASVVILCEPQMKPSIENQAISRAYRMGQARNVLVYRLLCEESIDERITDMLAAKQAIFDAFADKSVAAAATNKEEDESKTMGKLIEEEIERINEKNGKKERQ